jgi:hypothetical protein
MAAGVSSFMIRASTSATPSLRSGKINLCLLLILAASSTMLVKYQIDELMAARLKKRREEAASDRCISERRW